MATLVGYLRPYHAGPNFFEVKCVACANRDRLDNGLTEEDLAPLYDVNIVPYKQTCHSCLNVIMKGATSSWCELYENPKPEGERSPIARDRVPTMVEDELAKLLPRKLSIEIEVTEEELKDIVISAVEGGINYWAACVRKYDFNAGTVEIKEHDAHDDKLPEWHVINIDKIMDGLRVCQKKYPRVFTQWFQDRCGDAGSSDVILQCAIFGKAIYG